MIVKNGLGWGKGSRKKSCRWYVTGDMNSEGSQPAGEANRKAWGRNKKKNANMTRTNLLIMCQALFCVFQILTDNIISRLIN